MLYTYILYLNILMRQSEARTLLFAFPSETRSWYATGSVHAFDRIQCGRARVHTRPRIVLLAKFWQINPSTGSFDAPKRPPPTPCVFKR